MNTKVNKIALSRIFEETLLEAYQEEEDAPMEVFLLLLDLGKAKDQIIAQTKINFVVLDALNGALGLLLQPVRH